MNELVKVVLSLSLAGSGLILLLLLCRPLVKNRLSRSWQYYIWLVVIARLLLPLTPEAGPIGALFQEEAPPAQTLRASPEYPAPAPSSGSGPAAGGDAPRQGEASSAPASGSSGTSGTAAAEAGGALWQGLWLVWLGGALLLLVRKVTVYQSFVRYVRAGREAVSDVELLDRLARLGAQAGVKRPVELYVNGLISSPLLLGLFRPCIVLPAAGLPEADFAYTLRHELTHLRRRDLLYKWLVQLAVCLHWFNPLVWLMAREISRACELACDEAVIRSLAPEERRAYGDTLLRAMGAGGGYHSSLASVTLNESAELLKERLKAIMNYKKTSKLAAVLSLLLAVLLAAGTAAAGAYAGPVQPEVKGDAKAGYRYTQEGYYQPPYLFEIGWNIGESAGKTYASTEIPLPGGAMTVYLSDACKNAPQDAEILSALTEALLRLRTEAEDAGFPLTRPLVVSIQYTGDAAPAAIGEQAYEEGSLPQFIAAFALMDEAEQRAMLEKIYEDSEIAFFGAACSHLGTDSPLVEEFAGRAYEDGDAAFFSVLVNGHMGPEALAAWLARAKEDECFAFQSILLTALDADEELEELKAGLDRQRREEYEAHGVTIEGMSYFYEGQLLRIFLDHQPDSSVYVLSTNPAGTASVRVVRGSDGEITGVEYMTEEESAALLADMGVGQGDDWDDWDDWDDISPDWDDLWPDWEQGLAGYDWSETAKVIPVEYASVEGGGVVLLGDYSLNHGDRIRYDIRAEAGSGLQVALAKAGEDLNIDFDTVYYAVSNSGEDGVRCTLDAVFEPPVEPGRYWLFLRAMEGGLTNVKGFAAITGSDGGEAGSVIRLSPEELPEAVSEAMNSCAVRKWYVVQYGGRQYIRHNGFGSFAFRPVQTEEGWQVNIVKLGKRDSGDLLLSVPEGKLELRVDGAPVSYTELACDQPAEGKGK